MELAAHSGCNGVAAGRTTRILRRSRGFTVIELMIVVVILAILGTVAAPSLLSMLQTSKIRAAASDFYAALLKARSESIKRRVNVTVAPVGATWSTGWTVKYGTTTLIAHDALASDVAIQIGVPASSAVTSIVYGSNGRITTTAPNLIFYSTTYSTIQARCVSADPAGLPRVKTDTNSDATDGCN